jgi:hypothetical protein
MIEDGSGGDFGSQWLCQLFAGTGCGLVVLMQAFLDEGSTHGGAPLTCVGGYLFEPEAAIRFQAEWNKVLQPFADKGVTCFHASPCAYPDDEFVQLREVERKYLFRELVTLTKATARLGFVAELEDAVFKEWQIANPSIASLVGSKYATCCLQCLLFIKRWVQRENYLGGINYAFEALGEQKHGKQKGRGNPFEKEVRALMAEVAGNPGLTEAFRWAGDSFHPKGQMRALEAADLLAWTHPKLHDRTNEYVRIAKGLFVRDGLLHLRTTITPTALSFHAIFNESHNLRRKTRNQR